MLLWFVAVIFVLALSGAIYQAVAAARDKRAYLPPGQMISVGDRQLHLLVTGEVTEYPTVILEAGIASFSSNWYWVQSELSSMTRVVSYDRAGLGWSDLAPEPFDAYQSARDLRLALTNADLDGPYVVAAHSYGGLVMQAFTDLYSDEVVGLVLADTSHADQWARIPGSGGGRMVAASNRLTGALARVGIVRLFNMFASLSNGLPEQQVAEMKASFATVKPWITSSAVIAIWNTRTRTQINQAHDLGDLPLIVLSATERPTYGKEEMDAQQADLATLSANSVHQMVIGASHESLVAEKEHALVVGSAIRQVLVAAQTGQPLSTISISPTVSTNQ